MDVRCLGKTSKCEKHEPGKTAGRISGGKRWWLSHWNDEKKTVESSNGERKAL